MPAETSFHIQKGRFAAGGSRQGPKYPGNEDSFRIVEPAEPNARYGYLYVVCDGVGGHQKGEVASALAADVIERAYYGARGESAVSNLVEAVGEANLRVRESAEADDG